MEKKVLTSSILMRLVRHHSEFISYNFKIKYKYRVQKTKQNKRKHTCRGSEKNNGWLSDGTEA